MQVYLCANIQLALAILLAKWNERFCRSKGGYVRAQKHMDKGAQYLAGTVVLASAAPPPAAFW